MDEKHTRIADIVRSTERDILNRIVNAMLAAEEELYNASVQEWTRVLTDKCRMQKLADRAALATTC